jgi:tripartite-type tricarboxylate transporter receptor subunit TctC
MKLPHRRQFLHLAAGTAALRVASRIPLGQAYPTRPVRIIVGFPAGGANDLHARLIAEWLSKRFGRSFIVENRAALPVTLGPKPSLGPRQTVTP